MDRLEKAGLARRVGDNDDRRKVLIEAVPGAMERHAPLFGSAYTNTKTVLDGLRAELPGDAPRP